MERRVESRITWNCPVKVTLLGGPRAEFAATLVNVSGRGARLRMNQPLECDSVVRIDIGEGLLLGEVCYCATDGDAFGIGVQLEHSLVNLAEITNLCNRIFGGRDAARPAPAR